ncbi:MAG TPA: hypothetical protein VE422_26385, partial [Terriglobia bacterium]|nr:hypothetical protein [Terriglobia bacterium]
RALWGNGQSAYFVASDPPNVYVPGDSPNVSIFKVDLSTTTATPFVNFNTLVPSGVSLVVYNVWGDETYLYVAESESSRVDGTLRVEGFVRRIAFSTGQADVLASGLGLPAGIWGDASYLYVTDQTVVRRITKATGEKVVFAGAEGQTGSVDGIGTAARFRDLRGIWGDGTYLYVADLLDYAIRRIRISTSEATTLAGSHQSSHFDARGTSARFRSPTLVSGDGTNLYVDDSGSIRKVVLATGDVTTFSGFSAWGLWSDSQYLYVLYNFFGAALNRIVLATGQASRITPPLLFSDGVMPSDRFAVRVSWGDGEFLYGVSGYAVYKVRAATGEITHLAGSFLESGEADGVGNDARFISPVVLWGDETYLYIGGDLFLRRIDIATRQVSTVGGGIPNTNPGGDERYLYVPGPGLRTIERLSLSTGGLTRFAGDTAPPGFADGIGRAAHFQKVVSIWSDGTNLYVSDQCSIRKAVISTAEVTTLVGSPNRCGEIDGPRQNAQLDNVSQIWGNGRLLFFLDSSSVRAVDLASGVVRTIAKTGFTGADPNRLETRFGKPALWGDGFNLYFGSPGGGIFKITAATPIQYSLPAAGADYWTTTSSAAPLTAGYARVQPEVGSTTPEGVAIFGFRSNGVLVSEAAVPASPLIQQGRIYAEMNGPVNTGIGIANPNDQSATVSFYFTDADGLNFGSGTTTIAANQQVAAFLNEAPYNGSSSARSFTFTSSVPVGAIALRGYINERSEFLMTTLPVAPITSNSTSPIVLPHFAAGGGWRTQILLVNPTDETLMGSVEMDSSYLYRVAPRSSAKILTAGIASPVQTGNVRITPFAGTRSPVVSTVFSFVPAGITVTESGVATTGTAQSFRIFAESDSTRSLRTGVAIANTSSSSATVRFELLDLQGQPAGFSGSSTIGPNGHLSLFLNEIPGFQNVPDPFRGVLRVSSNTSISAIGVRGRYNERGDFLISTTPALADDSVATNAELVFPHIVTGGGYTTEFILMNRGNPSAGKVLVRSQSGAELALPLAH